MKMYQQFNIIIDQEYLFLRKDLKNELQKIGKIVSLVIPRLKDECEESAVGKVYVEFENEKYATIALILLGGKFYDGNEIYVDFYDAGLYADKIY